ncbi:MAG: 6-bladed beta-propeller [Acidobacteria bacterium]|nr:6-bladed beta-propeller [Acidobacteriota bacterium]
MEKSAPEIRARIEASPVLPFKGVPFAAQPLKPGWESGAVSGIAVDRNGTIYEIQRGEKADPIVVLDRNGIVLRSWGKGDFKIPHSIRIDPVGNVWTVDASSSMVIEYSPLGKKLMTIIVGGQPNNGSPFDGTTDVALAPDGHIFITDGYGNARVLEYTKTGNRVRVWGKPGVAPGEFNLPHSIQITADGIIYVADRENGRIEKFDLRGHFLGEIAHLGRVYSFKLTDGALWATMGPFDQQPGSSCWVVKLDPQSGTILGHVDVPQERGGHALEVTPSGEPIITLGNELLWLRK